MVLGVGSPYKRYPFSQVSGIRYWVSEVQVLGFGGTGVSGQGIRFRTTPF